MIGERFKHAFTGNEAWVLSYRDECFDQIGLKATKKIPLFNGALECQFRQYEIFGGKYKEFRAEGEELNKEKQEFRPRRERKEGEAREFKFRRKPEGENGEKREFRPRRKFGEGEEGEKRSFRKFGEGERDGKRDFKFRKFRTEDGETREYKSERKPFDRKPRSGESYPERKRRERGE